MSDELYDYTDLILHHANQAGRQRTFNTGRELVDQMRREATVSERLRKQWNREQHSQGLHRWTQGQP